MTGYNASSWDIINEWEMIMSRNINGWVVILVLREYDVWVGCTGRDKYNWMNDYNGQEGNIING